MKETAQYRVVDVMFLCVTLISATQELGFPCDKTTGAADEVTV
jgi:hypothetical protein